MKNLALICLTFISFNLIAGEALETDSFKTIESKILEKGKKYGVKNVLAVFDIDNTILTMKQNFGSDQWFTWQSKECFKGIKNPDFCVANNYDTLLDIQGQLFAISNMVPTELSTVSVINNLQKLGYPVILLTSRGPSFRNATERAIEVNGMHFVHSAIGPKKGYAGTFTPYTLKEFKKYGLTKSDLIKMDNQKPRPVSYMNGVFMTAGLNKGIMLKALLAKTNSKFKAIIFSDDHIKHTKRMHQILGDIKDIDLTTFRYSKIDPIVKAFNESDKKESINAWRKLKEVTQVIFK